MQVDEPSSAPPHAIIQICETHPSFQPPRNLSARRSARIAKTPWRIILPKRRRRNEERRRNVARKRCPQLWNLQVLLRLLLPPPNQQPLRLRNICNLTPLHSPLQRMGPRLNPSSPLTGYKSHQNLRPFFLASKIPLPYRRARGHRLYKVRMWLVLQRLAGMTISLSSSTKD